MKLNNLNVVELNAQEMQNVDGGLIIINPNTWVSLYNQAKNNLKAGLGILAGIADGYTDGLND